MVEERLTPERLRRLASLAKRHADAFESEEMREVADYIARQAELSTTAGDMVQRYHDAIVRLAELEGADQRAKRLSVLLSDTLGRAEFVSESAKKTAAQVAEVRRERDALALELEGMRYWHSLAVGYLEKVSPHIPEGLRGLIAPQAAAKVAMTAVDRHAEAVRALRRVRHWASLFLQENEDATGRADLALADKIIEEFGK
jgi:hypothetical protein